jgi:hypothetical protein
MKLFRCLRGRAPKCTHDNSSAVWSEIGHDAVRRYYWICRRCGDRVYVDNWKANAGSLQVGPDGEFSRHCTMSQRESGTMRRARWSCFLGKLFCS